MILPTDVISLISAIVGIIDGAVKLYNAASDVSGAPEAVRDAAARLPLIKQTLMTAIAGLNRDAKESQELYSAMYTCLKSCYKKIEKLDGIFRKVISPRGASRARRLFGAARASIKEDTVVTLMDGIRDDLQVLAANYGIRLATRTEMKTLLQTISDEDPQPAEPRKEYNLHATAWNTGTGVQTTHFGVGDLVVGGQGPQVTGVFHQPLYFTSAGSPSQPSH
ncbi:hypothetical protein B0T14DRAFT_431703 [Immersiella caudata]|uniref:NACHT-NTPase and P-loop NTPases N-terminal domain-containing protein n=1 Tax=Immersiella caudata TaxID=314043 RepID=A0AA39WNS1_9PEZI|nr:hypothetical protein B0T14DRAFT_431703 [Immersiella caudata]